ncbi:MAG: glutathione S-transferase N-terminal domain-containing protein [Alphaproteobacteria bacterium]|nr:glutathione S-transferase N-terminal domain-containing protein [Alphaproteobacteria bacterium]
MILRSLPHSPYARKVLVAAHETGAIAKIEVIEAHVFDPDTPLRAENPVGKVPALVRDDGSVLYDSTVICEWLDICEGKFRLLPNADEARIQTLRRNALGDGLGLAATWNIRERYRPDGERSENYMAYYAATMERCFAALEDEAGKIAETFDLGAISIACALSYVDFRYPDLHWQRTAPILAAWFEDVSGRSSMTATVLGPYTGPLSP